MEMLYVSDGMITFYVILGLFLLILNIAMIVKFFDIASDVRALKKMQANNSLEDLDILIQVMVAIGNKEEAKHYLSQYERLLIEQCLNEKLSDPKYISKQVKAKIAPLANLLDKENPNVSRAD